MGISYLCFPYVLALPVMDLVVRMKILAKPQGLCDVSIAVSKCNLLRQKIPYFNRLKRRSKPHSRARDQTPGEILGL